MKEIKFGYPQPTEQEIDKKIGAIIIDDVKAERNIYEAQSIIAPDRNDRRLNEQYARWTKRALDHLINNI